MDIEVDGRSDRVRLLNIDTPERGEAGYSEAREALEQLIGDDPVYLTFESPADPTRGVYGRLLAYLHDEDGSNLNAEMVHQGWSEYWTKYGEGRFPNCRGVG